MHTQTGAILRTSDPSLREDLDKAFEGDPTLTPIDTCDHFAGLAARLEHSPASLVIVDLAPDPPEHLAEVAELVDAYPRSRFVVVAPTFDRGLLMMSMQAGARHFLPREWINEDVRPVCRELLEQARGTDALRGTLTTVLSASGGCGATTIAVALADELARATGQRSLLVDLDVRFGGVAAHLGVNGQYGIAELLTRKGALDRDLVASTCVRSGETLDVLLSPATINFADPPAINAERIEEAVGVFRTGYRAAVVDAPSFTPAAAAALAGMSSTTLLVMNLTVKDLRAARATLEVLRREEPDADVIVVANRAKKKGGAITLADARDTLEHKGHMIAVPDDTPRAIAALNAGVPIAAVAPKAPIRRSIAELARLVSPEAEQAESAAASRKPGKRRKAA